jgi:hypothetical protein
MKAKEGGKEKFLDWNGAQRNAGEALAKELNQVRLLARSSVRARPIERGARYARNHDREIERFLASFLLITLQLLVMRSIRPQYVVLVPCIRSVGAS